MSTWFCWIKVNSFLVLLLSNRIGGKGDGEGIEQVRERFSFLITTHFVSIGVSL